MNARDWFGLVFRLAALWVLVWSAWQLLAAAAVFWRTLQSLAGGPPLAYSSFAYAIYGLPALLLAILALRFADAIVAFTYRSPAS